CNSTLGDDLVEVLDQFALRQHWKLFRRARCRVDPVLLHNPSVKRGVFLDIAGKFSETAQAAPFKGFSGKELIGSAKQLRPQKFGYIDGVFHISHTKGVRVSHRNSQIWRTLAEAPKVSGIRVDQ